MINIFRRYHIINNFPPNYPIHKKILANLIFFFTGIIIHPRRNLLTHGDLLKTRLILKKGDVVLMGNLRTILASLIRKPLTHSSIYLGRRKFIHSIADGVEYMSLHRVFTDYDTLAVLRLPSQVKNRRVIINKSTNYAKKQYDKPYDFEFKKGSQCFFCTELVNESYMHAGWKTGLTSVKHQRKLSKKVEEKITRAVDALQPIDFLQSNFKVVFLSHNLKIKNKKLIFTQTKKSKNN